MDLYGDYLTKVIGKGGDSNKTASDATPKSTGWAKPAASSPATMFKPTSVAKQTLKAKKDQLKPSSLLGTKAANVAKKRKKGPSLFMPTSLKKKVKAAVVTKAAPKRMKAVATPTLSQSSRDAFDQNLEDEYDPLNPNDYEDLVQERENAKKRRAMELRMKHEVEENERKRKRLREEREAHIKQLVRGDAGASSGAAEAGPGRGRGRGRGRGMTMPAWMTRGLNKQPPSASPASSAAGSAPTSPAKPGQFDDVPMESDTKSPASAPGSSVSPGTALGNGAGAGAGKAGMSFAQRIMAKMGYKKGKGLGKHETGITSALRTKRTGARSGKIVAPRGANNKKKRPATSRVVLLMNMVPPGSVDSELQGETQEECSRFGPVQTVVVHEEPAGSCPEEEAVKIFVFFEKPDSALAALNAMGGRFFAQRRVGATLFPEDKFLARDYSLQR